MISVIAVIAMALADRAYGNPNDGVRKYLAAIVMGYSAAVIMGHATESMALLYVAGFWMARSIGLGNAVGPALTGAKPAKYKTATNPGPEWWQQGLLLKSAWLSLIFLGFMWGAIIFIFTFSADIRSWIFIPICIVSVPLAVALSRGSWASSEYLRGGLIGLGILSWS